MRTRLLTLLVTAVAGVGAMAAAPASSTLCYDLDVVVDGEALVDEADCLEQ